MLMLLLAAVLLTWSPLNLSAQVQARDVGIRTPDGTTLKASYFSPGKPGPGVLLLHQCRRDRHAWDDFAADLTTRGMHVLAFDYRGYGETAGKLPPAPQSLPHDTHTKFSSTISGSWIGHKDVELAYVYLSSLEGVDKRRMAAGGASCGAGFAADLSLRHPEMRALFLMSGQISGAAAAHIAVTSWLPVFGAAARGDMPIAYEGLQAAIATSKNPKSMMKMYAGVRHGVEMFRDHPALPAVITSWLENVLGKAR
jgi:dienelactone hydrolase